MVLADPYFIRNLQMSSMTKTCLRRSNEQAKNHPIPACEKLHVVTFNHKHISNSGPIFEFCSKTRHNIDPRTLASHVSSYQLNLLDEINKNFIVSGKYVDYTEPIPPIQIPL